jgi:S1-C subfamily serine protease
MVAGSVLLVGIAIAAILMFQNKNSGEKTTRQESPITPANWSSPRDAAPPPFTTREAPVSPPVRQEAPPPVVKNDVPERPLQNSEPRRDAPDPNPLPADTNQAIPANLLDHLKSATVFVKVEGSEFKGSGSGFLIDVKGDTAYVVTNAHVIDPKIEIEVKVTPRQMGPQMGPRMMGPPNMPSMPRMGGPPFGRPGFSRGPMGPMGPMGPRFNSPAPVGEEETFRIVVPTGNSTITSVFWSGTRKEQSRRAQVVASDRKRDLAILKVTGCTDLTNPIDMNRSLNLQETMPVYVLGFPFGKILATNKGNPAITVGKGSISSIRRDERDEVALVQIDGALNPGNSGGPVVDTQGRLVGVAVATIKPELGSGIGFAVPAGKLSALLQGKQEVGENRAPGQSRQSSSPQKLFDRQPRVFLSDLEEFDVKSGPWPVSKDGALGDPENKVIQVNGIRSQKGLSMHPPDQDFSSVSYRLDKQATTFKSDVALNDSTTLVIDAAVFEVWGDGKRLWHSRPIHEPKRFQRCKVDVSKVDVLELRVNSTGSHVGLHAVWVEPRLFQKADTPDKD